MSIRNYTNLTNVMKWMGIEFYIQDDESVSSVFVPQDTFEGPRGHVHGGISTAILDEAMGIAAYNAQHRCLAVNLNIDFRQPIPLHAELTIRAWLDKVDGRKVYAMGEIRLPDGSVAVESKGLFIVTTGAIVGD